MKHASRIRIRQLQLAKSNRMRQTRRRLLGFEPLEDRRLLAFSVSVANSPESVITVETDEFPILNIDNIGLLKHNQSIDGILGSSLGLGLLIIDNADEDFLFDGSSKDYIRVHLVDSVYGNAEFVGLCGDCSTNNPSNGIGTKRREACNDTRHSDNHWTIGSHNDSLVGGYGDVSLVRVERGDRFIGGAGNTGGASISVSSTRETSSEWDLNYPSLNAAKPPH